MQLQNRSEKEQTDQRPERASLQELRVRRTSPVPDARDAYDELRQAILQILTSEIGRPRLHDGVAARTFIQAQLDEILRREKIILNRRERRQLNHDLMAQLLAPSQVKPHMKPETAPAKAARLETFFAEEMAGSGAGLLQAAVNKHKNILIIGKPRAGKTALLQALCNLIPVDETIITIEQSAELLLDHPHLVCLQTRDPGSRQQGDDSAGRLVRAAARARHNRLILDSLQGAEAYAWLQAVNEGQRGSMATCLALSAQDALARIEVMARQAEAQAAEDIRRLMARAIDLIVSVERAQDGPPRIVSVQEIAGSEKERFRTISII